MSDSAKSRMDRIIRLHEEIDSIKADIREVYAEEKADGGDKTAMGAAISIIRKREKDRTAFDDREAMVDVYLNAYASSSHTHAREGRSYAEEKGREHPITPSSGNIFVDLGFTAEEGREIVASKTREHQIATGTEQGHVESSAERASSAVEVGATNSPETAHELGGQQKSVSSAPDSAIESEDSASDASRAPATNRPDPLLSAVPGGEPSIPNSEADGAKMEGVSPPDRAAKAGFKHIHSEQAAPSISHSSDAPPPVVTKAETVVSSPAVSATPFNNPRCQHSDTCHYAHSENACHECLLAWASRPRDEQVRLWAEARAA